jgi:endonuclease/exonuclease/phosphatase family metal-dependent hydrolase
VEQKRSGLIARLFGSFFFLLNIIAVIWLGLCELASVTKPASVKYLSLFSLTIPFAIAANVFFIFLWLLSRRKLRFIWSLAALILCYNIVLTVFGLNFFSSNDMSRRPGTIKIMSWNAHGMGIYNRPRDKQFDKDLLEFIKNEDADILCLMEYPTPRADFMKPFTQRIVDNNDYKEFRFKDDNILSKIVFLGTAVFSKYPFKNYTTYKLSEYIYLVQGDVDLPGGSTVRMFFVHLNTFGFSDHDKAYIEEMKSNASVDDIDSSKTFISKLNFGFVRRSKETDIAAKIISQSPYPVVLCGDLNDLPGSYTYRKLRQGRNDAFISKGRGIGRTYNQIIPTIRIDHMFYDPSALKIVGFDCPRTHLSDHNPVIANFEIIPQHHN